MQRAIVEFNQREMLALSVRERCNDNEVYRFDSIPNLPSTRLIKYRIMTCALLVAPVVWFFGDALLGSRVLAFRDAAHYYYPLFEWCLSEWQAGRTPLWNPYENGGMPAVADATSSVFYPGKLIFSLSLPYDAAHNIYIVSHVLLAMFAAYFLARRWRTSRHAACLCAVSYACSGSVLFQYCNVVFLVGAAWLPFALLAGEKMVRERSWRASIGCGFVLAMMILGGDPQVAYHSVLLTTGYLFFLTIRRWRILSRAGYCRGKRRTCLPWWRSVCTQRCAVLLSAIVVAVGLAAIQIIPSSEWAATSKRAAFDAPRNIYEATTRPSAASLHEGMVAPAKVGTHRHAVYEFSVGPWRLTEFLWPNVSGRMFPINQRWLNIVPAEGRVWSPSLYMGLIPLVLSLFALRLRRGSVRDRWVSWLTIGAALASFGYYGVAWLVHEITAAFGDDGASTVHGAVGGLYWFMVVLLPNYVYFRYPAKLMVIATLGMSLLAGRQFDRLRLRHKPVMRILCGIVLTSVLLAAITWTLSERAATTINGLPADDVFGPVDGTGAIHGILLACLHTAVVGGLAVLALWRRDRHWQVMLLTLACLDICIANRNLVLTVPASAFSPSSVQMAEDSTAYRHRDLDPLVAPPQFAATSSLDRPSEVVAFQRRTHFGRLNLLDRTSVDYRSVTISSLDHELFIRELRRRRLQSIAPARVWIVHDVAALPPLTKHSIDTTQQRTREVFTEVAASGGFQNYAIVETARELPEFASTATSTCQMVVDDPQHLAIEVSTTHKGLLVLADTFAVGWTAKIRPDDESPPRAVRILPTNRIMRGVVVPAGKSTVTFDYQPRGFQIGACVSITSWLCVLATSLIVFLRQRRWITSATKRRR